MELELPELLPLPDEPDVPESIELPPDEPELPLPVPVDDDWATARPVAAISATNNADDKVRIFPPIESEKPDLLLYANSIPLVQPSIWSCGLICSMCSMHWVVPHIGDVEYVHDCVQCFDESDTGRKRAAYRRQQPARLAKNHSVGFTSDREAAVAGG
jgi:hypothetical protein